MTDKEFDKLLYSKLDKLWPEAARDAHRSFVKCFNERIAPHWKRTWSRSEVKRLAKGVIG